MDNEVSSALSASITEFKTESLSLIATTIPVALVVLVTVVLIFAGLRWFRGLVHI